MASSAALAANAAGLGVFRLLSAAAGMQANVVLSPYSLKVCLSMVADGATKGSATEKEMAAFLGAEPLVALPDDAGVDMANSAWVLGGIKADYIKHIQDKFAAEIQSLPGPDPAPINAWVKEKTQGRIEKLFEDLDPLTVMVLVNTIFFKGAWAQPFDAKLTKSGSFRMLDGASVPCDMMYKKEKQTMYLEALESQVVQLPYAAGGLSAVIFLPKKEGPEALEKLMEELTPEAWVKTCVALQRGHEHIELSLPRFKVEFESTLTDPLRQLGMQTPFKGEVGGAFLGLSDDPLVHIDTVVQKATIQVNEEGTVAVAATGAVMKTRCMPPPSVPMIVDRPFLFAIAASDTTLLFLAAKAVSPWFSGIVATFGK
mmetsp:Transcript_58225/g.150442  ORF Transcript_58225/g.150442 Transcript_58225/m.150442 type:complete len:371 (-) Transcript_58225:145-1257(-)